MKAGKILSIGLLSALMFGCEQSTQPTPASKTQVDGRRIAPVINALTKAAATKAGYGMSYEAATEPGVNPFDTSYVMQLQQIGICQNFIDLITEIAQAGGENAETTLMASPRFQAIVSCFEDKAQALAQQQSTDMQQSLDAVFAVFDECFCQGSGSVFGAIAAYAWKNYSAPVLNGYVPPKLGSYKAPTVPGYQAPSLPGYKAPSL